MRRFAPAFDHLLSIGWNHVALPRNLRAKNLARTIAYSGFILASALLTSSLTPALAADPTGDWQVADGVANIRVAQCNGSMWGVVAWEKVPGGKDSNNPDPAKQSRPTLGMPILIDMKKKPGVDAWEGQVYNAKDGQTYSSTIKPVRQRPARDTRLRARLPLRRGDLDPRRSADPLQPRQQHGQGHAAQGRITGRDRKPRSGARRPPARVDPAAEDAPPGRSRRPRRRQTSSVIFASSRILRGLPISAGWNNSTAASVVTSESASSLPMLAVPG